VDPLPRAGDPHEVHQLGRAGQRVPPGQPVPYPQWLGDLVPDGEDRIERGQRVLEDHGDLPAAYPAPVALGHPQQVAPVQGHRAGDPGRRGVEDTHHRQRGHRLTGPGFPKQGKGFPGIEVE
jgi:hypothetical protein